MATEENTDVPTMIAAAKCASMRSSPELGFPQRTAQRYYQQDEWKLNPATAPKENILERKFG